MLDKIQVFGMYIGIASVMYQWNNLDFLVNEGYLKNICTNDPLNPRSIRANRCTQLLSLKNAKLLLRPIEEMTEGEITKLKSIEDNMTTIIKGREYFILQLAQKRTEYLISIGICINEEWHKKGWVIYPNELKNKEN